VRVHRISCSSLQIPGITYRLSCQGFAAYTVTMGGVRQHLTGAATCVVMSTCGTTSVYDIVVMLQNVTHTM
jgi:hypothetical protein